MSVTHALDDSVSEVTPQVKLRVLLIAPHNSYRIPPFMNAAAELGLDLLIASQGKYSLVSGVADGLHIDISDQQKALTDILANAQQHPLAGVIASDDIAVELASRTAEALGLPGNPPAAAMYSRRKDLARERLKKAGVPVPWFKRIDLSLSLAAQLDGVPYPCVVKPVALSASRGVIRANDREQLLTAISRITPMLKDVMDETERRYLLVEQFIHGREYAIEGMLSCGRFSLLAVFDKPDDLDGPYFEETYYITPSRADAEVQQQLAQRVQQVCHAYGLSEGPVHAELRVNETGVWVMEVAARSIGGECAQLLRFGTGYSLEQLVLSHAVGKTPEVKEHDKAAGVLMIPVPEHGILRRVEGVLKAQRIEHVEEVKLSVREGYELIPLPEGDSYLGFIFASADSAEQVEAALRQAHACLNIVVAPVWKPVRAGT